MSWTYRSRGPRDVEPAAAAPSTDEPSAGIHRFDDFDDFATGDFDSGEDDRF